jgi:hypothetical protein
MGTRTGARQDVSGVRLGLALLALAGVAVLLAYAGPSDWPRGLADVPRWLAAPPPEARVLAFATVGAYGCLAWLAFALLAVAAGAGHRVPGSARRLAERLLGVALVTAAAGVLAVAPAAADPGGGHGGGGPFDRPAVTLVTPLVRPAVAAPRAVPDRAMPDGAVVVRRGDTLWDIAARHLGPGATPAAIAREWPRWYAANRAVVGPDPGRILPGQRLVPPVAGAR